MTKTLNLFSALLVLGCFTISAYSQCPTFYTDANLQGKQFQLCSTQNVPDLYNDQVSSFTVPSGYVVTLYQNTNYDGQSLGPYNEGSYEIPDYLDNQLSSVTISQFQNPNCVTFYTDISLQGNIFQLCSSGNVPKQYNDRVSSFVVPGGYSVTFYQDSNYGGQSIGPYTHGTYNIPSEFNDQLSSAEISRDYAQDCPTFYVDSNLKGDSFQLCSNGNVPGVLNDQVSSFHVPRGYIVRLYADADYNGQSKGPFGQGSYNMPDNFDDQLSSVVVRRR